jgi:ElaB/YqjD/DUF883 family membrane-anchored ribosome-binding protein
MALANETETGFATGARRHVEEFVEGIREQAGSLRRKSIDDIWKDSKQFAKDNPGKTILASLAVGVLVGSLIRRR